MGGKKLGKFWLIGLKLSLGKFRFALKGNQFLYMLHLSQLPRTVLSCERISSEDQMMSEAGSTHSSVTHILFLTPHKDIGLHALSRERDLNGSLLIFANLLCYAELCLCSPATCRLNGNGMLHVKRNTYLSPISAWT